jgi:hypothetical protein
MVTLGLLALLLGACAGGPRLASQPSVPVDLSGHWTIEAAASDDAAALIRAVLPKPKEARRPQYDGWGNEMPDGGGIPSGGGRSGGGSGSGRGTRSGRGSGGGSQSGQESFYGHEAPAAWGHFQPYDYVAYFAVPMTRLDLEQIAGRVRIGSGNRLRSFVPGDEEPINLTDRFGSRSLRGGWIADAFVISSEDGKNLHVLDSMRRTRDDHLERVTEVKITGLKSLSIHSRYRRSTEAEITSSGDEGPPSPMR